MTLTETRGLDSRTLAWRLLREQDTAWDDAQADAADALEDLAREVRPRPKRQVRL